MKETLKRVKKAYTVQVVSKNQNYEEWKVIRGCDLVNITIWKEGNSLQKGNTFGVYGDDNSPQGKEEIPISKLEDLLEILL